MKVSELITKLQEIEKKEGDINVIFADWEWCTGRPVDKLTVYKDSSEHPCSVDTELYPVLELDS